MSNYISLIGVVPPSAGSIDLETFAEATGTLLLEEAGKPHFQATSNIFVHVFKIHAIIVGRCSASQLEPAGGHA